MATKKARVLVDGPIGDRYCKCNDIVLIDDKFIDQYVDQGVIDPNPAAVKYAESLVEKTR